tara:strand:- start:334 stop:639 length:306 start_codon:yes stop_codon:yes gene_type:complete
VVSTPYATQTREAMWKEPTSQILNYLIKEGLTEAEIAEYYGCNVDHILSFFTKFNLVIQPQPIIMKEKKCLRCKTEFPSEGCHNRVCQKCKKATPFDFSIR